MIFFYNSPISLQNCSCFIKILILKVKHKATSSSSSSSSKSTMKTTTTKVREKKVYNLPGQKHDPPEQVLIFEYATIDFSRNYKSNVY